MSKVRLSSQDQKTLDDLIYRMSTGEAFTIDGHMSYEKFEKLVSDSLHHICAQISMLSQELGYDAIEDNDTIDDIFSTCCDVLNEMGE